MKKLTKKLLAFFLVLVMTLTAIPVSAGTPKGSTSYKVHMEKSKNLALYPAKADNVYQIGKISGLKLNQITVRSSRSSVAAVTKKDLSLPGHASTLGVYVTAKKPGTTDISVTIGKKVFKSRVKIAKYANPIASVQFGSTKLSGKVFDKTNHYNRLKYAKYANKNQKIAVKMKRGWKLTSISYIKKGWSAANARKVKNGKSIPVKGGSGFQVRISAMNTKTKLSETLSFTLTGKSVPDTVKPPAKPTPSPTPSPTPTPKPDPTKDYIKEVVELVNKERSREGLSPLTADPTLEKAATIRAKELDKVFDHVRPDGTDCFTVLDEVGAYYYTAGENIAAGQINPAHVMESWMNSPGHRSNILRSSFGKIGVGYYKTPGGWNMWVQMFTN